MEHSIKRRKITQDDEKIIVEEYLKHNQMYYLYKKYGYSNQTVERCLIKYNIPIKRKERGMEKLRKYKDEIIKLYETDGIAIQHICKKFECDAVTLKKLLKENNIKIRTGKESINRSSNNRLKNFDYFDIIDTEEKAYWLGFIYADGCITKDYHSPVRYCLAINLSFKDKNHLEKFAKIFNKKIRLVKTLNKQIQKIYEMCILKIHNQHLANKLIDIGIFERKTYSDDYKILDNIPKHLIRHFIRGYVDGDGSYHTSKKDFMFSLAGRLIFLEKIQNILIENIENLSRNKIHLNSNNCLILYKLRYGGNQSPKKIIDYLYKDATIYLDRKYQIIKNHYGEVL